MLITIINRDTPIEYYSTTNPKSPHPIPPDPLVSESKKTLLP
jgi:hypothetical protein